MLTLNNRTEAKASDRGGDKPMAVFNAGPRKIPPVHPGAIIEDLFEDNDLNGRKVALAIGMTPAGFGNVLNAKTPVTIETALRLGKYFGNGPDLWLDLQRNYDLYHARKKLAGDLAKIKPLKAKKE
jgi:addiction module HigA family antidote